MKAKSIPWSRLVAEGAIIVASILLAFAIDAWWGARQDQVREEGYLALLASDLESTLANIDRFGSMADSRFDPAAARLVRAYFEPELPPEDSLRVWLSDAVTQPLVQPRLGTAESLVESGDLALIRSDSLKTAIRDYLVQMTFFSASQGRNAEHFYDAWNELTGLVNLTQVQLAVLPPETRDSTAATNPVSPVPAGPVRPLPPLAIGDLVRDPNVHAVLTRMLQAKASNRQWRGLMQERSEALLEQVEGEQR